MQLSHYLSSSHTSQGRYSVEVGVVDLFLVEVLLLDFPLVLALFLLKSEALVLILHLLELLVALLRHLVLEHASHAVHGQSLFGIGSI